MRERNVSRTSRHPRAPLGFVALLLLAGLAFAGPTAQAAGSGPHPLYDDGGALRWYTDLQEACAVAEREGKLILVDVSTTNCLACKTTIGLMADASIHGRVSRVAIGYHVDARRGTALIGDFRANLRSATYLPLVGFFTPGIEWVSGFAPARRTSRVELRRRFLRALVRAESRQRRNQPRRARTQAPARPVTPAARAKPAPVKPAPAQPAPANPAPVKRAAPKPAAPKPAPAKPARGALPRSGWYASIAAATAAARAEGKIVFVTSTKPGCGLCKKLKENIVPQVRREMAKGCVFYIYDITRPESWSVDRLVRANLPGARLMPLAGFVTPDMRWLHGFYGSTDAQKLMADYRTALRSR